MIRFTFYGQAKPEKEITKDLKNTIENWLEEMTEKQMINLLQRNPKFPFNHIDYRFICSASTSPKKSLTYKLPEFVSDLYLFILFLKQNIATHLGIHSIRISPDENRINAPSDIGINKGNVDDLMNQENKCNVDHSPIPVNNDPYIDADGATSTVTTLIHNSHQKHSE